jgi:hypothetical protein
MSAFMASTSGLIAISGDTTPSNGADERKTARHEDAPFDGPT